MTHDMWLVTCEKWHLTCDTWWGVKNISTFQFPSSFILKEIVFWKYFSKGLLTDRINQTMSDKHVCRTALATPGLLTKQNILDATPPLSTVGWFWRTTISEFLKRTDMRKNGCSKFSRIWAKFYLLKAELTKQALFLIFMAQFDKVFQICIVFYICFLRSPEQLTFNVPPSSFKITWLHSSTLQ